jgi:hypothetical protein
MSINFSDAKNYMISILIMIRDFVSIHRMIQKLIKDNENMIQYNTRHEYDNENNTKFKNMKAKVKYGVTPSPLLGEVDVHLIEHKFGAFFAFTAPLENLTIKSYERNKIAKNFSNKFEY